MSRYFRILRQLLLSYFASSLAYRMDFLQSVFSSLLWSGLSFFSAFMLTSRAPSVAGLQRVDLLLLAASYGVIVGTHHWLCSRGFGGFAEVIHKGELDGYLLKPFDTLTYLSLRNVGWGSFVRVLGSLILLIVLLQHYDVTVTASSVGLYFLLSVLSIGTVYSIYTIACTFLIWHPYLSNIIDFVQNSVGTARYPLDIRRFVPTGISLFFIPFMVIVNIPTRALTGRLSLEAVLYFVLFAVGLFVFSRAFWQRALRFYTGASA